MAFVLLGFKGGGGRRRRRDPRRRRLMDLGSLEDTHPQLPPHHRIGMPYPSYFSNGGGAAAAAVTGPLGIPNSHLSSSSALGSAPGTGPAPAPRVRYRECQKNHAASMGGQAVDGCGEFMAAGRDGSAEAFKCAACGCHRNFHRREEVGAGADGNGNGNGVVLCKCMQREKKGVSAAGGVGGGAGSVSASKISVPGPQPSPLLEREQNKQMIMATVSSATPTDSDDSTPPPAGLLPSGGLSGTRRKRFRTKFTPEQKEVLFSFAETLGWKIQKHDENVVQEFCRSTGITRSVLKVWLHNNKNTRGKNA